MINRSKAVHSLEPVYDYDGRVRVFGHVLSRIAPLTFFKVFYTPTGWGAAPLETDVGAFFIGISQEELWHGDTWFIIGGPAGPILLPEAEVGQTLAIKDNMVALEDKAFLGPKGFAFVTHKDGRFVQVVLAPREVYDDAL